MTISNHRPLVLVIGGLMFAALATPAFAQSVDVGADGSVRVDGGDGTVVQTDADGTQVRARGVTVESRGRRDLSSRSGNFHSGGDNVQRSRVDRSAVEVEVDGGVHVTGAAGGRAITTIGNRTLTSGSAAGAVVSYVNQDLNDSSFAGRWLEGVAFVNSELKRADFRDASLVGANFANAELVDADFRGANLRDAQLANAELSGARFDGATWVDGRVCGSGSVGGCR